MKEDWLKQSVKAGKMLPERKWKLEVTQTKNLTLSTGDLFQRNLGGNGPGNRTSAGKRSSSSSRPPPHHIGKPPAPPVLSPRLLRIHPRSIARPEIKTKDREREYRNRESEPMRR